MPRLRMTMGRCWLTRFRKWNQPCLSNIAALCSDRGAAVDGRRAEPALLVQPNLSNLTDLCSDRGAAVDVYTGTFLCNKANQPSPVRKRIS